MKVKTNLQAGQGANWENKWKKCMKKTEILNQKISALEQRLYSPPPTNAYYPGYVPVYPQTVSYTAAGQCPGQWYSGFVEKSSGGGYYGAIRGQDGLTHYYNQGYTQFFPSGQGVSIGQPVMYAPYPPGNERAGKAACISSLYAAPY